MTAKQLLFAQHARAEMLKGVDVLADAVRETLGPRGRNVLIEKSWGAPTVTKDGVTVAKEISLENKFRNIGTQMVKEVASHTSDTAGDGTTTATVLAQAIFREGLKAVSAGLDPMDLKNYRPVANLPFISKVAERCVARQLTVYLKENCLFPEFQSAYRKNHSVETALLHVQNDVLSAAS